MRHWRGLATAKVILLELGELDVVAVDLGDAYLVGVPVHLPGGINHVVARSYYHFNENFHVLLHIHAED